MEIFRSRHTCCNNFLFLSSFTYFIGVNKAHTKKISTPFVLETKVKPALTAQSKLKIKIPYLITDAPQDNPIVNSLFGYKSVRENKNILRVTLFV